MKTTSISPVDPKHDCMKLKRLFFFLAFVFAFLPVGGIAPAWCATTQSPKPGRPHTTMSKAPLVPAQKVHFQLDVHGVYLIWTAVVKEHPATVEFDYRIYRSEKGSAKKTAIPFLRAVVHQDEGERWSGVDTSIQWEKTYIYWVRPVTRVFTAGHRKITEIEGPDSEPMEVIAHDVFPPARPEDLLAFASDDPNNRFVDLIWAPNMEKDVVGYNVYRREDGADTERINSAPIKMLSFQDAKVIAGHKYFYAITAVDLRGNESAKSQETAEVKP